MGKGFDLGGLFRQAQQLQEKIANIQQELAERTVEASAGGGMVTAVVSGKLEVVQLRIERSEEHTSELQSPCNLVCRLLLEKKKKKNRTKLTTTVEIHSCQVWIRLRAT